jgi:peroxiredoxin
VQLDRYYARIAELGVSLYAVSVDPPETSRRLRERLQARFTFLSDSQGVLLDALGIRHRNAHEGRDIAFPTAVLVDADGIVRWTFQSDTYRQRARPEDVFAAIAALPTSP